MSGELERKHVESVCENAVRGIARNCAIDAIAHLHRENCVYTSSLRLRANHPFSARLDNRLSCFRQGSGVEYAYRTAGICFLGEKGLAGNLDKCFYSSQPKFQNQTLFFRFRCKKASQMRQDPILRRHPYSFTFHSRRNTKI